jgi:hypothetical protein
VPGDGDNLDPVEYFGVDHATDRVANDDNELADASAKMQGLRIIEGDDVGTATVQTSTAQLERVPSPAQDQLL